MKKRLLCFALCLVLLLPSVLAGCKKDTNIEDKIQQTATTLTMWVVTENEESVSEEAKKLVSAKLDEITKDRFKVHLIVNYITEDAYRKTLDNEIRGFYETRATTAPITDDDETQKTAETEVNEWGITVIKYPAILPHQVDIVYLQGEDMFKEYAGNGWLSSLNIELDGNSKALRSNINTNLLSAASYDGEIYAIPNNRAVGDYTVMLLNKELMAETDTDAIYRQGKIDGFFNSYVYNYVEEVKAKGDDGIVPINADYSECLDLLAYFWNINPDTLENEGGLSVIGYRYEDLTEISRSVPLAFNSLFTDAEFTKAFLKLKEYQFDGGYFGATDGKTAALSIAKMGYEELASYRAADSAYYPVVLKNPTVSAEDVYGSMFGVCSQTVSLEHSMKVITLLNTNAEFRNILQYGVEGKTYQLVPDPNDNAKKVVSYSSEYPYRMDVFKTGNAFLAYPEPGMDEAIWENGKVQNRDISGADPTLDLDFRSIATATIAQNDEDSWLGGLPYVYSVKSGLSRDIYMQNDVLREWIEECDKAGKGTYWFKALDMSGQTYHTDFYVYNNEYSAGFSVSEDDEGNLKLALTTGKAAGTTVGCVSVDFKSSTKLGVYVTLNGEKVEAPLTSRLIRVSLDYLNTETYQIRLSSDLTKSVISANPVLWKWFTENCKEAADGSLQLLRSKKTMSNGKIKYTYLVYAPGLEYATDVSVDTEGSRTALELKLVINDTDVALDPEFDRTYALCLVTVETDPEVEGVRFYVCRNDEPAVVALAEPESDPEFTYCGTLDSELVRYLYDLNGKLAARIEACTDMEELKALLLEIKRLLTPQESDEWALRINRRDALENPIGYWEEAAKYTLLGDLLAEFNLEEVNYAIIRATSTQAQLRKDAEMDENGKNVVVRVEVDSKSGEEVVLLDSPYALYSGWLKTNGYVK